MAKPIWSRTLSDVLGKTTEKKTLVSERTGKKYETDIIPTLFLASTGSVEEVNGKYRYSVVDTNNDLEYAIKVPNKLETSFGKVLMFTNVRGGMLSNGYGWYAADTVQLYKKNG